MKSDVKHPGAPKSMADSVRVGEVAGASGVARLASGRDGRSSGGAPIRGSTGSRLTCGRGTGATACIASNLGSFAIFAGTTRRHYGLLASATRRANLARIRDLLAAAPPITPPEAAQPPDWLAPCPCCGGRMTVVENFGRFRQPRGPPTASASTRMRAT